MKVRLLFNLLILVFCAMEALFSQNTGVMATDALTDNATMPELSDSGQTQDAITPAQDCVLLGPTSQDEGTPPNVILNFHGSLEGDNFRFTQGESWYLNIDINAPGWLYLYEYFPPGGAISGEWLAYKWELLQSGSWKLGPFTPREDEEEGQHTYRIWFFSDGQWADEGADTAQDNLISWAYFIDQQAGLTQEQQTAQPAISPSEKTTLKDRLSSFFNQPLVLSLTLSFLIFVIICGVYLLWTHIIRPRYLYHQQAQEPGRPPASLPSVLDRAKILLPNGLEIKLNGYNRVIGRSDLARTLDLDLLGLISRQHFQIKAENQHFYIEDLGSDNGTRLNGEDISGKGPVDLSDNDTIEPAGALRLKFNLFKIP